MKARSGLKRIVALGVVAVAAQWGTGVPARARERDGHREHEEQTRTRTPIKHVMLIIGENRTFDHVFGTFEPAAGQTVRNLLSEGILNADGTPGPNFSLAEQWQAVDTSTFSLHPKKTAPYNTLPDVNTDGTPTNPHFSSVSAAQAFEPALPADAYNLLTIGGSGLPHGVVDTRFPSGLRNGPFDITRYVSYHDYTGSPVHRFFQMWQQSDCDPAAATPDNPSGCQNDLYPWVETTVGIGSNGQPQPSPFTDQTTGEGSISMGVYNSAAGDGSYFTQLAHEYAMSDNFHQSVMGGTGANHVEIGYGAPIFYAAPDGSPTKPPVNQIENPDPQPNTNNFYKQDGYSGGSYVNCADESQPGVASIRNYLRKLPYRAFKNGDCARGAYYLVNNYAPGYLRDGTPAPLGPDTFTVPPTRQRNIGLELSQHHVSWKYYGEGWDNGPNGAAYCNICNPFQYSTQIMTNPALRANLQDIPELYADIQNGTLPAVSIVKPDGLLDGHPASSKWGLFEAFTRKIVDMVKANPALWKDTAIMITTDEGGGYWDSGYVQPIDFFGDGPRIPFLVVSPYARGGAVVHTYADHVSFDKFVEANWGLGPISGRSRDRLPNPRMRKGNPYVPINGPAIGDLMDMFQFGHRHDGDQG